MRTLHLAGVSLVAVVLAACSSTSSGTDATNRVDPASDDVTPQGQAAGPHGAPEPGEPPMLGAQSARDAAGRVFAPPGDMTFHGGSIMTSALVTPIFWGASWANASFVGDKIDGLTRLYSRFSSATSYVASNTEYTGTNGRVGTAISYAGYVLDLSSAPSRAPKTSAILSEVCRQIANPVENGYYPVYTDTKRGGAGYCAWHSAGSCNGVTVQFAFFFDLDGDSGCDPSDTQTSHSQGLAALANVTGHELSEAMTDPRNGGWYDSAGNENSDKCAWTFPPTLVTTVDPITGDTEGWKIQGNWSNAAFDASSGYANRNGQRGCRPNP